MGRALAGISISISFHLTYNLYMCIQSACNAGSNFFSLTFFTGVYLYLSLHFIFMISTAYFSQKSIFGPLRHFLKTSFPSGPTIQLGIIRVLKTYISFVIQCKCKKNQSIYKRKTKIMNNSLKISKYSVQGIWSVVCHPPSMPSPWLPGTYPAQETPNSDAA